MALIEQRRDAILEGRARAAATRADKPGEGDGLVPIERDGGNLPG
jgi:hypothetical protein